MLVIQLSLGNRMLSLFQGTRKESKPMLHIKQCLSEHKVLNRLKEKLADNGDKKAIRSLLSEAQKQEVISITRVKSGYIVTLKSAYALYGIRDALRNFGPNIRVVVGQGQRK